MKLSFHGASRQVTGSMYLLELDSGERVLLDCGMDFEKRSNDRAASLAEIFPFDVSSIDHLILTHAHLDHSGQLPNLVKAGFDGQVHCTHATYELTEILLYNAAGLHQDRIERHRKALRNSKRRIPRLVKDSLYGKDDVRTALNMCISHDFDEEVKLGKHLHIRFITAGHLLGAAHVVLTATTRDGERSICFSGDIGRTDYPLLPDPSEIPPVDYLVCESTYGNRKHRDTGDPASMLEDFVRQNCVDVPGRLIIPAFSIGRTQSLLYTLHRLQAQGRLPRIHIYTDSPLARQSTRIYQKYAGMMNDQALQFSHAQGALFDFEQLNYLSRLNESIEVSNYNEPCIIISASGMMEGGRIQFHVRSNIENSYAAFLFIGYCAEGTFGHQLIHNEGHVSVHGKKLKVQARILQTDIFSGHADVEGLFRFVRMQEPDRLRKLFIVHGEESAMEDFRDGLLHEGYRSVEIPAKGDSFELD